MPKRRAIRKITVENAGSDTLIELDLSAEDEAFVTAYFDNNMNATQAYLELHPNVTYDTARANSSKTLAKTNIRARIAEVLKNKAMGRDEVLARLGDMARASHQPYIRVDDDGFVYFDFSHPYAKSNLHLIKKIKTKRERRLDGHGEDAQEWEGEWVEVELHDPQRALELIGKYYRMFADKREDEIAPETRTMSVPADLIASDFLAAYRDIMRGNHAEYTFDGGRGGVKSTFVSEITTALLVNNPTMHALALRQVKDTLRESVYSQLKWAIDTLGLTDKFRCITSPMEMTYLPTGQKIYFRGADDPSNIKSIKPPFGYIGIVWFEEFDQFKGEKAVRNIIQSAIRGGDKAYRFASWNTPRTKLHWVHRYMKTPDDRRFHTHSNYLNVPQEWLGSEFLEIARQLQETNPDAYDHEYMGVANGEGGMVFQNIESRHITDEEIRNFDNVLHGVDWGFSVSPFAYVRTHYDATRLILYIFDEMHAKRKRNDETYKALVKEKKIKPNDLIIADSADTKSVADYKAYGANCRGAEKGDGSRTYSMRWLQGRVKIVIDPKRCPYAYEQFTNYESQSNKEGDVIDEFPDKNDDFIDATRYATNMIWRRRGE